MKTRHIALLFLAALCIGSFAQTSEPQSEVLTAGKEGNFNLPEQAKAGGQVLEPGSYIVQHRVIGNDHYIRLRKIEKTPTVGESYPQFEPTDAGVIKCTVEPLGRKVEKTRIFTEQRADGLHITKVEIAGENDMHIF